MAQYALDRVISVAGSYAAANTKKGIAAGDVAFLCDQVQNPSLSFTSETEDIVDARNNVVMRLQNARGASFSAENAFFNTQLLAAQVGGTSKTGEVEFKKYDIVTLGSDKKAVFTATPAAGVPAVSDFKVFKLAQDNSFTSATALETSAYTMSEDNKSIVITGGVEKEKYMIVYMAKQTGEHITATADSTNELLDVTAEVLLRELCNEERYYAFIIMRGKLSGETEWSMTRDGSHGFEIQCQTAYCDPDKTLVEVVIVKGEDLVA